MFSAKWIVAIATASFVTGCATTPMHWENVKRPNANWKSDYSQCQQAFSPQPSGNASSDARNEGARQTQAASTVNVCMSQLGWRHVRGLAKTTALQ
jgi:hypothetical protein